MTIHEALSLAKSGHKVRPICWREKWPDCWISYVDDPIRCRFVVHAGVGVYRFEMDGEEELMGEWEVIE